MAITEMRVIKLSVLISVIFLAVILITAMFVPESGNKKSNIQYDPDLGWSSKKNYFDPAEGIMINSRGFRNTREFDLHPPQGKLRVICSGDSFTFGFGVKNDDAWCQQLTVLNDKIETINMGQRAYGIDQAYLWYLRDGIGFEHQAHVFGIIYDNFNRFGTEFLGRGKPVLTFDQGQLKVSNVPVPRKTHLGRLLERSMAKFGYRPVRELIDPERSRFLALKIFEELNVINKKKNSRLVVVYLPTFNGDLKRNANQELRILLRRELSARGIDFIDLTDDFQKLKPEEASSMFNVNDKKGIHYSVQGNRHVAQLIYQYLSVVLEVK